MMMDSQENALVEEQNVNEAAVVENTESAEVTEMVERKQYDTKKEVLERVREIAQMMSGERLTDAAMENASLLLSQS
jgi:DNA repair ATPase RecN